MNYYRILGNTASELNVKMLSGSMAGKSVLVLSDPPAWPMARLKLFFDVIIAEPASGSLSASPDIYVSARKDAHENGIFDLSELQKYQECLYITDIAFSESIVKTNKKHRAYTLQMVPTEMPPESIPYHINNISYGVSSSAPGHHIALIAGASNIYSKFKDGSSFESSVSQYMEEKANGRPKNILSYKRTPFVFRMNLSKA